MTSARAHVGGLFREQADGCRGLGSPLYAHLLSRAADDIEAGGPAWGLLRAHAGDPPGSALALRFMGAVHRLVLRGLAPDLAGNYPSAGGRRPVEDAWPSFRAAILDHSALLREEITRPVQTNEVGRCAALVGGFLVVARETSLPLRVLEIGSSAGLNLRWDRFSYEARGATWGPRSSPVRLCSFNTQRLPPFDVAARVTARRGCDTNPLDAASPEDRLTLTSFVWGDQLGRLRLLRSALEVAATVPAPVDRADATQWLERQLGEDCSGAATVVFHSIVAQYLPDAGRIRLEGLLEAAGRRASPRAPLAWLRMEPAGDHADVHLTTWPGRVESLVAHSGYHGAGVEWLGR